ncbi:MAG TPA: polysaccharide biosynthesis tyrosine autokinase, partial [Gemmataceae bacterium]|nr:polysaccharide biosynthesis tyrosine autokinase [Gemmataceae bacterium]
RGGEVNWKTVPGISQEDLTGVRARIAANKLVRDELTRKLARIDSDIALIASVAGAGRSERLAVMSKLGIPPDRPAVAPDAENPEELLRTRKQERQKLAARLGPDHREMVVLQKEIDRLEKVVQQRKTDGQEMDELGRHLVALKREQAVLGAEGKKLDEAIAADEKTAAAIGELQGKIDRVQGDEAQVARRVQEKELEKAQAVAARPGAPKPEATTTSEPAAQTTPAAPTLSQPLWVGALLGLLLGGGCALAGALGGRTPRPSGDIRRLGVPVLGTVPKIRTDLPSSRPSTTGLDPLLAAFFRPNGPDSAAYHAIRDQLLALTDGWGHQVLQVSSPGPGDGKSTLAANLAISLAQSGKRVLLLDCDFGTARIQRLFNLRRPEVGLTSVTGGEVTLEAAVQGSEIPNLFVMGCGSRPSNPADLLGGPKFAEVLAEVRDRYEFVVVDTPPVLTTGDAAVLAAQADGVLLVFRTGKDAGLAERAREQLGAVGARVLGAVANTGARGPAGPVGPMQQPVRPAERPPAEEPIGALPKKG